jgi:hypothetical protein
VEVCVVVIDDAILQLRDAQKPGDRNWLEWAYPRKVYCGPQKFSMRTLCLSKESTAETNSLIAGQLLAKDGEIPQDYGGGLVSFEDQIESASSSMKKSKAAMCGDYGNSNGALGRRNFNPLACFESVVTDAHGRTSVTFQAPDTLTRYHVAVICTGEAHFGYAESKITSSLPVVVRPSLPRFLVVHDAAHLAFVVSNNQQKSGHQELKVGMRTTNGKILGFRTTLKAKQRGVVKYPFVPQLEGEFGVQAVLRNDENQILDLVSEKLVVLENPGNKDVLFTSGSVAEDDRVIRIPFKVMRPAIFKRGSVRMQLSSTQSQCLKETIQYMIDYVYECSEQLASRLLTVVLLKEFCPDKARAEKVAEFCLGELLDRFQSSRGCGMYKDSTPSLFVSLHVIMTLSLVHPLLNKKVVDEEAWKPDVTEYLVEFPARISRYQTRLETKYGVGLAAGTICELKAQAFCCHALLHKTCHPEARELLDEPTKDALSTTAKAYLILALMMDRVGNAAALGKLKAALCGDISDQGDVAHVVADTSVSRDGSFELLHSSIKADAVALYALLLLEVENPMIPKLCKGLLGRRQRGRFGNTLENFWAVLALQRYFQIYEGQVPDFETRLWVAGKCSPVEPFKGRSKKTVVSKSPIDESGELLLLKRGPGRLYYDLQLSLISSEPNLKNLCFGFGLRVTVNGVEGGGGREEFSLALGDQVRIVVEIHVPILRHHVVISCPIAGGLEIITSSDDDRVWWADYCQTGDDAMCYFVSEMRIGVYRAEIGCAATTSGAFLMRSARVECMYREDLYGSAPEMKISIS